MLYGFSCSEKIFQSQWKIHRLAGWIADRISIPFEKTLSWKPSLVMQESPFLWFFFIKGFWITTGRIWKLNTFEAKKAPQNEIRKILEKTIHQSPWLWVYQNAISLIFQGWGNHHHRHARFRQKFPTRGKSQTLQMPSNAKVWNQMLGELAG